MQGNTRYTGALNLIRRYCDKGISPPASLIVAIYAEAYKGGIENITLLYSALLDDYPDLLEYFNRVPGADEDPGEGAGISPAPAEAPAYTEIMYR